MGLACADFRGGRENEEDDLRVPRMIWRQCRHDLELLLHDLNCDPNAPQGKSCRRQIMSAQCSNHAIRRIAIHCLASTPLNFSVLFCRICES